MQQRNRPKSSPCNSTSESKRRKKKTAALIADATLATVDEQEAPPQPTKSTSERKRQNIRLKYGLNEKDQEFYRKTKGEDNEEFENVNAVARPAATKMRKAKLKWKTTETKEQESSFGGTDKALKSIAENTEEITDEIEGESQENSRVAEIKRRVNITNTETADKMQELTELRILIIRIEELELANRKLTLQIRRMKKQLSEKERKIEELTSLVSFLQKTEEPEKPDEKPTSQQEATAVRGLEIMKRNQLLEHSVRNVERTMLCNFFEAVEPKPTQEIVMVIDRALSNAIDVLLMRPDKFDDFVDNELRIFLLDTQKAKRILLDVMLLHPEYVPRTWGGDVLAKRQSEARLEAMRKRQPAQVSDSKTNVEKENPRQNLAAPNGKSFAKTSAISKGVQLKSIRMAPNVMKTDQTPPPKSNPDTSTSNTQPKSPLASGYISPVPFPLYVNHCGIRTYHKKRIFAYRRRVIEERKTDPRTRSPSLFTLFPIFP